MRKMTTHIVKSWPQFFKPMVDGTKKHDLRKNDRDWKIGDILELQEFDPILGEYTGSVAAMKITFITNNSTPCAYSSHALDRGYSILSVEKIEDERN